MCPKFVAMMPPSIARRLLDCLQAFPQFLQFSDREIQVLIALRLIVLELPKTPEDGGQFLLVGYGHIVGGSLCLLFRYIAIGVQEGMELIMVVVERSVFALPPFALAAVASIILVRLIIVSRVVAPFACEA